MAHDVHENGVSAISLHFWSTMDAKTDPLGTLLGQHSFPKHLLLLPKGGQDGPQKPNICIPRHGKPPWMPLDHQHCLKTSYFGYPNAPNLEILIPNVNNSLQCLGRRHEASAIEFFIYVHVHAHVG